MHLWSYVLMGWTGSHFAECFNREMLSKRFCNPMEPSANSWSLILHTWNGFRAHNEWLQPLTTCLTAFLSHLYRRKASLFKSLAGKQRKKKRQDKRCDMHIWSYNPDPIYLHSLRCTSSDDFPNRRLFLVKQKAFPSRLPHCDLLLCDCLRLDEDERVGVSMAGLSEAETVKARRLTGQFVRPSSSTL